MQHVSVLLEHVDLLHARDRLHVQLLQRTLELLVVLCIRRFRFAHDFSPHGPLPAWTTQTWQSAKPNRNQTHHHRKTLKSRAPKRQGRRTDPVCGRLRLQLGQFCGIDG